MNNVSVILTSIAFAKILAFSASQASAEEKPDIPLKTLVKGNSVFAWELYRKLGTSDGNLFFSPFSVSSALGMIYSGARENTAEEIRTALSFGLNQESLNETFLQLNQKMESVGDYDDQKLTIANGICLTGGEVSEEFKALVQRYYRAEVFSGDLEKINGWVKEKTGGKIERILANLDPNSVCTILNAIYFKGVWENQFDEMQTNDAPFKLADRGYITVPFMYRAGRYKLFERDMFQAISMPYRGKALEMIVLLPRNVGGLNGLESDLSPENLEEWLAELDSVIEQDVVLEFPKFKFETSYDLVTACAALGIKDAFSSAAADFSGMGWPKGDLWISQIKHKAFIEVNEEGTESAAATAVEMATKSISKAKVFKADRPFIFLIRENSTGSIIFMGRVANPGSL